MLTRGIASQRHSFSTYHGLEVALVSPDTSRGVFNIIQPFGIVVIFFLLQSQQWFQIRGRQLNWPVECDIVNNDSRGYVPSVNFVGVFAGRVGRTARV